MDSVAASNKRSVSQWVIVFGIVAMIYGVNLFFPRYLWVQDEARYGEVVREMIHNGSYLVPTLDGEFYPDKPPLYFWLLALQSKLTGMNAFSFRLVTLLTMFALGGAFFVFCRRLIGPSRAIWAELVLMTNMLFIVGGNIIRMDMLMALFVLLSIYFFIGAVDEGDPRKSLLGHVFAILAMGVKGPLGIAFPLLGAMGYGLLRDKWLGLKRLKILHGLSMAAGVVCVWAGYLYFFGHRAYLEDVFIKQILGRSVKSWSHAEPIYFYALVILPLLMPWLPLLYKGAKEASKEVKIIALCWFVPGFLLISMISGKLFIYLIPIVPAVALVLASGIAAPWEREQGSAYKWEGIISGIFFTIFGLAAYYALFTRLPQEKLHLTIVPLVLVLIGIGMIVFSLQRATKRVLWWFLLGGCLVSWVCMGWGASQLNDYLSTRKLALAMAEASKSGYRPVAVDTARGTISFYAGMIIRNVSRYDLSKVLDEPGLVAVAIRNNRLKRITKKDLARLRLTEEFPKMKFSGYSLYLEKAK